MIFSYSIFPLLDSLTVAHGNKGHHSAAHILHPGIFRTCHQLRYEALSFLATNKKFEILSTHTARVFLDSLGPAIADVKRITVAQPIVLSSSISSQQIDAFFRTLDKATSLRSFKLEMGSVGAPTMWQKHTIGDLSAKAREFVKSRPDVDFQWRAGEYNMTGQAEMIRNEKWKEVRDVLGGDRKGVGQDGLVQLW